MWSKILNWLALTPPLQYDFSIFTEEFKAKYRVTKLRTAEKTYYTVQQITTGYANSWKEYGRTVYVANVAVGDHEVFEYPTEGSAKRAMFCLMRRHKRADDVEEKKRVLETTIIRP